MFVGGIVSVHPSVVDVPFVPPEKIPRALLTSPGGPMPVDDRHVSSECPSLAMRCVTLAWSQPWTPLKFDD